MERIIEIDDSKIVQDIMGSGNRNAKEIEKQLAVVIEPDRSGIRVSSDEAGTDLEKAVSIIEKLTNLSKDNIPITNQLSAYLTEMAGSGDQPEFSGFHPGWICLNAKGKPVMSKTSGQSHYVSEMRKHEVTFAVGPAGTGKTYLAVAMAVQAFRKHEVDRIILTRPAVEAGERLGFLPGDLQNKVDPYMRPLYDALQDLMGTETYLKNMEKNLIEVSPLAYMRGRTLDNAWIILDEAQNTTPEQMKMFLTRIGFDSRVVVTGDVTQIDLPRTTRSGLIEARQILRGVEGLSFVELTAKDVVRNPIVQRIIRAYEKRDKEKGSSRRSASDSRRSGSDSRRSTSDPRHSGGAGGAVRKGNR